MMRDAVILPRGFDLSPLRVRWLLAAALCDLTTRLVQRVLRPWPELPGWSLPLLHSAPSLLYSLGFTLAVGAWRRWPVSYPAWGGAGTVAYELLQPWLRQRTFDPMDVLASLLGVGVALALLAIDRSGWPGRASMAPAAGR